MVFLKFLIVFIGLLIGVIRSLAIFENELIVSHDSSDSYGEDERLDCTLVVRLAACEAAVFQADSGSL